jgi:hypothetical protein
LDDAIAKSLEEFRNRKIYEVVTLDLLDQLSDSQLERALIDYIYTKIGKGSARELDVVRRLKMGLRALYITWWVEAEVNNGGFNQYYWNSAGQFADEAPDAFAYFGAEQCAELMREANRVRAAEAAAIEKYRDRETIEAFSESHRESKLGPLDKRFYALAENLGAMKVAKIRAHAMTSPAAKWTRTIARKLGFEVVDVRDLADVHIRAMTLQQSAGERFLATGEFLWTAQQKPSAC